MNVWYVAECAFAIFLIVMLIGCSMVSIQLTIKKYKQNKFDEEMQEEANKVVKEIGMGILKDNFIKQAEEIIKEICKNE